MSEPAIPARLEMLYTAERELMELAMRIGQAADQRQAPPGLTLLALEVALTTANLRRLVVGYLESGELAREVVR